MQASFLWMKTGKFSPAGHRPFSFVILLKYGILAKRKNSRQEATLLVERASGILLHPTALPGPHGIGDLGSHAREFIDFLQDCGQKVWQLLPLGPTGYGDSPYSSFSAFAGNPLLVSLEALVANGDLLASEIAAPAFPADFVDYGAVRSFKSSRLQLASLGFATRASEERRERFADFCAQEAYWLDDYALYSAIRCQQGNHPWVEWPAELRDREPQTLLTIRAELQDAIVVETYSQFVFAEQWQELKDYAAAHSVRLFGDLPIFVAEDSADVWAHRDYFQLDNGGRATRVAGVPPDYFSATGQRWGNPLYNWEKLQADGFSWWVDRLRRNLALYDLIRIDHFRGFAASWSIPAAEPTAVHGHWEPVPGQEFFTAATACLGALPVIAEDLGYITPDVEALRDHFGYPGMKILHFAFGGGADNPYLPHNYQHNCVVYSGTHDNDTTAGWWQQLGEEERYAVARYLGRQVDDPVAEILRLAAASVSRLCIFPLQDLLKLDSSARFNRPGAPHGNWQWRWSGDFLSPSAGEFLKELTVLYRR
ncbi:MAG: 4-alpha-glucanotransferase, partial [Desulfuromonadales bacterium]|nr:4-alpha-glucanotransferase [Desulfuromonadales bacterium]